MAHSELFSKKLAIYRRAQILFDKEQVQDAYKLILSAAEYVL